MLDHNSSIWSSSLSIFDLIYCNNTGVARWVTGVATDASARAGPSRLALLSSLPRLCNLFGCDGTLSCVLPLALAFLNDRDDWRLRASLCRSLPAACAVVGRAGTIRFTVPCVETALTDEVNLVVAAALDCLQIIVSTGLLTRALVLGDGAMGKSSGRVKRKEPKKDGRTYSTSINREQHLHSSPNNTGLLKQYG